MRSEHAGLSLRLGGRRGGFHPSQVPAILAGYFWDPNVHSGLGGTGFRVPELQGKTAKDLLQATVALQPTTDVANGNTYFRFDNVKGPIAAAAGAVGSTGPLYIAAWMRVIASAVGHNLCVHSAGAGARGFNTYSNTAAGAGERFQISSDGTATTENRFAALGSSFQWVEYIFDGADAVATHRAQQYLDLIEQTPTATASHPTSAFDSASAALSWCVAGALDTIDVGMMCLGIGSIPTLAQRAALRAYRPLA